MSGLNETPSRDFLTLRPRRLLKWEIDPEGRAVLLRPKLGPGPLGRFVHRCLGPSFYRIRLDDVGTAVWVRLDGETRLASVLSELNRQFGSDIEPARERLKRFVDDMINRKLIEVN